MPNDFYKEKNKNNIVKFRELTKDLPIFLNPYLRALNNTLSQSTKVAYVYDLKIFFNFLMTENPMYAKNNISEFTIDDLKKIDVYTLEEYVEYLTYYVRAKDEKFIEHTNGERGISRKISSLRSMYTYFYKKGEVDSNPAELIDIPKIHTKPIVTLDVHEVANLLDEIESGENLTKKQKDMHKKTKKRDLALVSILLGTGMRISECVGININDIDFSNNSVKVIRKGGNESILYFNNEVATALKDYKNDREKLNAVEGNESALFLSMQNKRITQRAVQNLVKKYAHIISPLKKISPHKLRSTYATSLYKETQDIYLVADALGHANVATTQKHYARMDDERRREAAKHVKLR
ncbi:MAG: tyrosine-type recombinase/integrase [Lachnospirales bacterium]